MDFNNKLSIVFTLLRMVYCDNTNDGKDVERFVNKLEKQADVNRKYSEECMDAQYTQFSVNNCDMEINDLLNMYRSLYDRTDLQDSVTVITIVLESISEHYVEKDCTDAIIVAIQKLMHLKKSYIKVYDLSIKIEDVKMASIAGIDRINTKVDNTEKIHNELEKLVVESIYEFCCEIFQELLRTCLKIDLDWFLWRRHCDQKAPTLTQEYLADKYKTWIEYLDDTSEYYRFRENLYRYLTIKHSLFDPIYRSICEYENYLGNKYFSNDISALKKSYVSCLKYTYDDLLDECMHAFVSIMLPVVRCRESKKQYMDLFHFACTEMLQDCEENKIKILGCADIENHLRRLYNREAFNRKLESYAVSLYSEQLNLKLRNAIDVIKEKFCRQKVEKRVTKIVLSNRLDIQKFNHLCRALKETQSVKHMCEKKFMFIDFDKCLNEEQIHFDANKCRSFFSCYSDDINVVVFSRFKSHGDIHATTQLLRCETEFAQFKENVATTNLETIAVEPSRPVITLSRCDITKYPMECKESISQQIYKCLGPNKNKLMSLQVIQLNGITNPTSIYVFDSVCEETKSVKNTVIYDICQKDKTIFFRFFSAPSENIKCFDDVSVLYLDDLLFYIQSIFLTNCTLFQIPNLCTINNSNLVYQEKTFDITTPINPFFVTKSYLDNLYNFLNPHRMPQGIQVKDIVKYYKSNCINISDCYVKDFVKNLGIGESAFFQILYRFILNKNLAYKPEDIPYKIRKRTYSLYGVQAYVKHHIDKSAVLVLSEVRSCNTYNNLSTNLNRILASLRANENDLAVWEFLDYVLSSIGAKMTIKELIIEDMCKSMQMDVEQESCKNVGAGVQNCIQLILRSIDTLYIPIEENVKKSSKSTHNPRITAVKSIEPPRRYIKAEEVEHFVETIVNELRDLVRRKTFKFTAIKLGYVKEPYYWYEVNTIELPNCNEQYDDLSHFDCQKCQDLYKFDKAD